MAAKTATAGAVNAAKVAQHEAESEYYRMLAAQTRAETKKAAVDARRAELALRDLERKEKATLAHDQFHHRYVFNGSVDGASANKCIDQLTTWQRSDDPPTEIEIVFNSPGGSVVPGLALFDYIQFVRESGIHVTTSSIGYAASMAGILLQAGDQRVIGRNSWLLIHEGSFGAVGSVADVKDTVKWVDMMQARVVEIFAERSKLSKAQIKRRMSRTDWWMSAPEALKLGFVDQVR